MEADERARRQSRARWCRLLCYVGLALFSTALLYILIAFSLHQLPPLHIAAVKNERTLSYHAEVSTEAGLCTPICRGSNPGLADELPLL